MAAHRDRIARQYVTGFADVLDLGVPRLLACRAAGWTEHWAMSGVYLRLLAAFPDSHVERKHGAAVAPPSCGKRARWARAAPRCRRSSRAGSPTCLRFDRSAEGSRNQSRHQR